MNLALVTLEDRRAVYALLDRMLDWLPPARLSVARDTSTKPGVGTRMRCDYCAGTGRVAGTKACRQAHTRVERDSEGNERILRLAWPYGHGCTPCPVCGESGYVAAKGTTGTDGMLTPLKPEKGFDTADRQAHEKRRWVDSQLVKLAALQRQHDGLEDAPDDLSRAVAAKERLWLTGSFPRLELALELLAATAPMSFEALRVFVIEAQFDPSPPVRARLDETVEWVAARMPRPILLPADARSEVDAWKHTLEHGRTPEHRRQRELRDREISVLREEHGWSLRRLAALYALSPEGVRKIVERTETAAFVASGPVAA